MTVVGGGDNPFTCTRLPLICDPSPLHTRWRPPTCARLHIRGGLSPLLFALVPGSGLGFVLCTGCQTAVGEGQVGACECIRRRGGGGKWRMKMEMIRSDNVSRSFKLRSKLAPPYIKQTIRWEVIIININKHIQYIFNPWIPMTPRYGYGVPRCAKIQYRTHTRVTRFGNTAGIPVPMQNPNCHNIAEFTDSTSTIVPVQMSSNPFEWVRQNTQLSELWTEPHIQF